MELNKKDIVRAFYTLEGKDTLCIEKRTEKVRGERKIEHLKFPLIEADSKTIFQLRLKKKRGEILLIFKEEERYFYTFLPEELAGRLSNKTHLCATMCKYLSALPDSKGGCAVIRDGTVEALKKECASLREAIRKSDRIEKYDFIKKGYEIFGTNEGALVVMECDRYKNYRCSY